MYPLAVSVNVLGERSETFLKRHVVDLLPTRTISIGRLVMPASQRAWEPPQPIVDPEKFTDLKGVVDALQHAGVRVVLGEYLDESLPWIDAVADSGLQLFAHAHGYDVSEQLRDAAVCDAYLKYQEAGGIITMSEHSRSKLIAIGLPREKVHVIPYGTDVPPRFSPRSQNGHLRVIAVGRMVAKKAPLSLLEAFRIAKLRQPGMRLEYVGAGPLLEAVHHYVHASGLNDSVTLHGALPNDQVRRLMQTADTFLQHSVTDPETGDEEGLPVAILEAMAEGLPVIATRHAGIPESVLDGVTGFLVDEGDTEAMASRLLVLDGDLALRNSLGAAGWMTARDRFTWSRERHSLLALFGLLEFE